MFKGTSPGLDDAFPFTSSLQDNRATIINATLSHGSSYFVSVKGILDIFLKICLNF